jgi:hypothetical protein
MPLAKNFDKEIIFLHSFAAEEICSPATVAYRRERTTNELFGGEIFRQRRRNT